jgi:hypothetical protein
MSASFVAAAAADDDVVVAGFATAVDDQTTDAIRRKAIQLQIQFRTCVSIDGNNFRARLVRFAVAADTTTRFTEEQVLKNSFLKLWQSEMNADLDEAIEWIDQTCQLSDSQREELCLAGRADRRRFIHRVQQLRRDCLSENEITAQLSAELDSLRQIVDQGALGADSFFAKVLLKKLTNEQLGKWNQQLQDHLVESVVTAMEGQAALQPSQRKEVVQLIQKQIPLIREDVSPVPIYWSGWHVQESIQVMELKYHLSLIAEEKLQPLLNDVQWRELQSTLEEFASYDGNYRNAYLKELHSSQLVDDRLQQRLNRPVQIAR